MQRGGDTMPNKKPLLGAGARKATTLRLPDELHVRLKQEATRLGLDVKSLIVVVLLADASSHSLQWLRRFPVQRGDGFVRQPS